MRWMPFVALIVCLLVRGAVPAFAQESRPADEGPVRIQVSAMASSAYVWRGFTLGDRMVVQPTVSLALGGLTVSSWGNLWHADDGRAFSEHDLTLEYSHSVGLVELAAGWVNYFFRDTSKNTTSNELYARAGLDSPLAPSIAVYRDVQAGSGTYVALGIEQDVATAGPVAFSATAALGYNHRSWTDVSALSDATCGLRSEWQASRHFFIAPFVTVSRSLNDAIGPSRVAWAVEAGLQ